MIGLVLAGAFLAVVGVLWLRLLIWAVRVDLNEFRIGHWAKRMRTSLDRFLALEEEP